MKELRKVISSIQLLIKMISREHLSNNGKYKVEQR